MAKFLSLSDAIKTYVVNGDMIALEGFTHLIPFAAGHEIIRQNIRELTVVRMTPDIVYDQLIGVGAVEKMIFSWGGNPGVGSLHRFRDAYENGWPQRLEIEEYSHAALAMAYEAGASGITFAVLRGFVGSDLPKVNPHIRFIECPYVGELLATVPAMQVDVAIIHAQKADKAGNVLIEGILGVQKEAVLGAKKASIVTVEEVVDNLNTHPNACILPHWTVSAIAVVPGGAYPSYTHGYYSRSNAFYKEWDEIARERTSFLAWIDKNVREQSPEAFARHGRRYR